MSERPLFESMPLTGGDLRAIADALDAVERTELAGEKLLGRIEVYRPDTDTDERIGWVARFADDPDMGWGYTPEEEA